MGGYKEKTEIVILDLRKQVKDLEGKISHQSYSENEKTEELHHTRRNAEKRENELRREIQSLKQKQSEFNEENATLQQTMHEITLRTTFSFSLSFYSHSIH
jgi:predicted  nucleic acid-binding Zn-ribbon protein